MARKEAEDFRYYLDPFAYGITYLSLLNYGSGVSDNGYLSQQKSMSGRSVMGSAPCLPICAEVIAFVAPSLTLLREDGSILPRVPLPPRP